MEGEKKKEERKEECALLEVFLASRCGHYEKVWGAGKNHRERLESQPPSSWLFFATTRKLKEYLSGGGTRGG